ncbi:MAG: hypothetical protein WKG01_19345 [Kofleriaceae bacterium]
MRPAWLCLVLACGGHKPVENALITPPSDLSALRAPHDAIFLTTTRGLVKVHLDAGIAEAVKDVPITLLANGAVGVRDGQYLVRRGDGWETVPGVRDDGDSPVLSPDGKRFVVRRSTAGTVTSLEEIILVTLAEPAAVKRFPMAERADDVRWSKDSSGLLVRAGRVQTLRRLDLATGAFAPTDEEGEDPTIFVAPRTDHVCSARGLQLEVEHTADRQQLVVVAIGGPANPDQLGAQPRRVLVEATHRRSRDAGELGGAMFTRTCEHFVFTLGDHVYVGELATGKFAFLVVGTNPTHEP